MSKEQSTVEMKYRLSKYIQVLIDVEMITIAEVVQAKEHHTDIKSAVVLLKII